MATKPCALEPGDRVAIVSPSWGGPHAFPHIFDLGLSVIREELGLQVVEMPHARADPSYLDDHPRARADDINAAFADPGIAAIVASIGGDDSVRILPYVDFELARANPKILMGYSDTVTLLASLSAADLVTFHGPSVMAGFAQARRFPPGFLEHLRAMLFEAPPSYAYAPYPVWSTGYPPWSDPSTAGEVANPAPNTDGWRFLQGSSAEGRLFGGCIEVLEFLKGTRFWPPLDLFAGAILFLETSEESPPPSVVKRWLRNYGTQGILDRIAGLLVGRPHGYSAEQRDELDAVVLRVVRDEFGRTDLPVVSRMDFGHTDPQLILPLGVRARIDSSSRAVSLIEAALVSGSRA